MIQGPVAIILAAQGQGKRMKSERAKVLHEVCGRPIDPLSRGRGRRGLQGPGRCVVVRHRLRRRRAGSGDVSENELPGVVFASRSSVSSAPATPSGYPPLCSSAVIADPPWCWWATSRCSGPSPWPTFSTASAPGSRRRASSGPPCSPTRPASGAFFGTPRTGSCGSSKSATARRGERDPRGEPKLLRHPTSRLWDVLDNGSIPGTPRVSTT